MSRAQYEIIETLTAYDRFLIQRGVRRTDGQPVLLKRVTDECPSPRDRRRLEFEYRIIRKVDGPGVVRALALEISETEATIVYEDTGCSVLSVGPKGVGLDLLLDMARQLVVGIGNVHHRGVIHNDIRTANVSLNPQTREVRLANFLLASELPRERRDLRDVTPDALAYISPERTGRMNRDVDYRSDYYSLGVTLFELATGQRPFQASDPLGWAHCHISKRPPLASDVNPEVPGALAEIIVKLLAKDPDDRYQSARGLLADLDRCRRSWRTTGSVAPFTLGTDDVGHKFALSRKLVGRERELETLLQSFTRAVHGDAPLLLVSGESGIGKTCLIAEVHRPIVERRGYFVSGKFDQLDRTVPYAALASALRALVQQLLVEPEDRLAHWRSAIGEALGSNQRGLLELVPELEPVLKPILSSTAGPAANARGPLGAAEAQRRFKQAFQALVGVFAQSDHPLVMFLDDLQWADVSTLDLLKDLCSSGSARHLLVIAAYRDGEVYEGHPLSLALKEIVEARPDGVSRISLGPLDEDGVRRMVADTLRSTADHVRPLAALLFEKTGGNPFFVNELLGALHRDGMFTFDVLEARWRYDAAALADVSVTDDVADLLARRLREMPPDSLAVVETAACVGFAFDLATVATVSERGADETAALLWEPIRRGILVPLDANYRLVGQSLPDVNEASPATNADTRSAPSLDVRYQFRHDRVRQAAYDLVPDAARISIHLKAGRVLRDTTPAALLDEKLFEIVNHLNLGRVFIEAPAERASLAALNFKAGLKAKASAAYGIAQRYCSVATELLAGSVEPSSTSLVPSRFEVLRNAAECALLDGQLELSESLCDELLGVAQTNLERASSYSLKTALLEHEGRLGDAIAAARSGLALLGVDLPEDPAAIDVAVGKGIARMQEHLAHAAVEDLARLPDMTDPEKTMVMDLLFQVIPPAVQTYPPLFMAAELMMFDLALTHGTTPASCKNFVDCGIIQGAILGNYDLAYRLGQTAFALLERYRPTPLESAVSFVFAAFVSHWRAPHREGLEAFAASRRVGLELGDIQHVAYAIVHRLHRLFYVGTSLATCETEASAAVEALRRIRGSGQLVAAAVVTRALAHLTGSDANRGAREAADRAALETVEASKNVQYLSSYAQAQAFTQLLLDDLQAAQGWQSLVDRLPPAVGLFSVPDGVLVKALLVTRRTRITSPLAHPAQVTDGAADRALLDEAETRLAKWAENAPANFAHKHKLLVAERARLAGKPFDEVLAAYDDAYTAAGTDFVHLRALIRELEADYCADRGQSGLARLFMGEAFRIYARWGARAKLSALQVKHPDWMLGASNAATEHEASAVTSTSDGSLDLASVFKATRALSGEVKSELLFARLMEVIIENAGAERGCLILRSDTADQLFVEACADIDAGSRVKTTRQALEEALEVPHEIVRYVARTKEPLVLDDAEAEGAFRGDPCVRDRHVRAVMCIPLLRSGDLMGVLYVENNAIRGAFSTSRLGVMRVIASQAAISIANARLYENLEQKVAERTAELEASRRQFQTLIETVNGVPWEMDVATMQFTYVGPQGTRLLGYAPAEWGAPGFLEERLHPEDRPRISSALEGALESGEGQDLEFRLMSRQGKAVWVRNVLTVRDHVGHRVLRGMIFDQTKNKQLEIELRQAQKLESVGRLASGIAHEINTPIQFVSDSVQFLRGALGDLREVIEKYREGREAMSQDPAWEARAQELAEAEETADLDYVLENAPAAIDRSVDGLARVTAIVRSMKDFAHPDHAQKAPADINRAIETTLVIARNEYKYVAEVKTELGELPKVVCHVGELNQVVLNLVVNAAHAISDVVRDSGQKGLIKVRTWREGEDAVIAISDSGTGIPEGVRDRIFDPFFTTKEVGRGTGQGLNIARSVIVDGHGGTLTFETESGKGTTFFIRLPITARAKRDQTLAA